MTHLVYTATLGKPLTEGEGMFDYDVFNGHYPPFKTENAVVEEAGGSTPSQYGIPTGATDLQDLIEHRDMNFAIGNIFKAAYRMGTKNDDLYELNKIIWFAQREKARILGNKSTAI